MTANETRFGNFFRVAQITLAGCVRFCPGLGGEMGSAPAARLAWKSPGEQDEGAVNDDATNVTSGGETGQNGRERGKVHRTLHANAAVSLTTKVVVGVVGTVVTLVGVVMLVTPGPAFVLIPLGLAILATEFAWAHRWLEKARDAARAAKERAEAMDPKVRRRRILLAVLAVVVVIGAIAGYVAAFDWPSFAVAGWDWVQSIAGWVPDLPGM